MKFLKPVLAGTLALVCLPVLAHTGNGVHADGVLDGFAHPFTGVDHLLAMLAVGIWSVRQSRALALPLTFMAMMLVGVLSGVAGLQIPELELGIALTVLSLGLLIALGARVPTPLAMLMMAVFAVLHGNAHGHELPQAGSAMGLLAASALLIVCGRAIGRASPVLLSKLSGAGIAAAGLLLTLG